MNRIQIHMVVNVTKKFDLVVPKEFDPVEYAENLLKNDPALKHAKLKNVYYDEDTELPISVKCFLYKQRKGLLFESRVLHGKCLKMAFYIGNDNEPLDALHKLKTQSEKDGSVMADYVISLAEPFQQKFTVDELLNVVSV
jgi:hypothetical protein